MALRRRRNVRKLCTVDAAYSHKANIGGRLSMTPLPDRANRILGLLNSSEINDLLKQGRVVGLPAGKTLYVTGEQISRIYFINDGLVSIVGTDEEDATVGLTLAGDEAVIGCLAVLERRTMPFSAVMVTAGSAFQIPAEILLKRFFASTNVRRALLKSIDLLFTQVTLSAVCNSIHTVQQRLSRWLLVGFDLSNGLFRVKQRDLSVVLGVARPSISLAMADLQKIGVIGHRRGIVTLIDRDGLEDVTCSCYHTFAEEYGRFFDSPEKS